MVREKIEQKTGDVYVSKSNAHTVHYTKFFNEGEYFRMSGYMYEYGKFTLKPPAILEEDWNAMLELTKELLKEGI